MSDAERAPSEPEERSVPAPAPDADGSATDNAPYAPSVPRDPEAEAADAEAEAKEEERRRNNASAAALTLEIVGDLPHAEIKPPENILFVCKLNPVTRSDDLELIFSRFGKINSCEVIRDKKVRHTLTRLGTACSMPLSNTMTTKPPSAYVTPPHTGLYQDAECAHRRPAHLGRLFAKRLEIAQRLGQAAHGAWCSTRTRASATTRQGTARPPRAKPLCAADTPRYAYRERARGPRYAPRRSAGGVLAFERTLRAQ